MLAKGGSGRSQEQTRVRPCAYFSALRRPTGRDTDGRSRRRRHLRARIAEAALQCEVDAAAAALLDVKAPLIAPHASPLDGTHDSCHALGRSPMLAAA